MFDDLEEGGSEDLDEVEFPTPQQKAFRKKIWVIIIIVAVVLSTFGIWYAFYRPWSIEDLDEKMVGDYGSPSFDPYLAGTSVYVGGKVTDILPLVTTQGPLTLIELDDFPRLSLVEWEEPSFEIGDEIVREVHFEWATYDDYRRVISPQVDFPFLWHALFSQLSAAGFSSGEGFSLNMEDGVSLGDVKLEVDMRHDDGFPLDMFNATLKRGNEQPNWDYLLGYRLGDNPELDHMESLIDGVGENETLLFVDANSNGLLDDGDFFEMNLDYPTEANSFLNYVLQINDGILGMGVMTGWFYIPMNNKGSLQFWDPDNSRWPGFKLSILSEYSTVSGVTTEIVVVDSGGGPLSIDEVGCKVWTKNATVQCITVDGEWKCQEYDLSVTFSDTNGDGYLNEGDIFTISNLVNWTYSTFQVRRDYDGINSISWTTGLGVHSANFPGIEWADPVPLDSPVNRTFKLQVERMYGVPGVSLDYQYEMMVVDISRNGLPLLSSANLTKDFNFTSANLEVTFEDTDGNGYVNSGDSFTCTSQDSAEYTIALGYVNTEHYGKYDQPLVSWPVSWQTD